MVFSVLFAPDRNPFVQGVLSLRIRLNQNSHHVFWFCIDFPKFLMKHPRSCKTVLWSVALSSRLLFYLIFLPSENALPTRSPKPQ